MAGDGAHHVVGARSQHTQVHGGRLAGLDVTAVLVQRWERQVVHLGAGVRDVHDHGSGRHLRHGRRDLEIGKRELQLLGRRRTGGGRAASARR